MRKLAFKMKLKPGYEKEYEKRHNEIWPELVELMKNEGISDYTIFLDEETLTLFAVQQIADDNKTTVLDKEKVMRKWWNFMADIMETNPDKSPVSKPLKKVFHLN
jgi:L-rhamnose mutarotase